ncbi:MAG: helix-turN-helix domain protein [Candidatus Peregrinibacteria bacterium GW2011_GWC2_39_14]|nr:MAG: Helix-turn-helix domain protein [Candidatus Peregrinibacteria bacterium GW2011_GWA2_38_36]KKR06574.1 MAG: helix-turN-helix domain protein [Candidatus Peregrinibacteria bacterium GW2011_GWC2_39_14]
MKDFILKLRKSAGLSQEDLSKKLGMSRPTLIAIEKGERDITITELRKISEIFDIPVEVILDEDLKVSEKINAQGFSEKSFNKFHNLILQCIKYGSGEDFKITKTKLAKLVYLCDFASYYKSLNPISGFEYKKLPQGPVAIEFFDIIDQDESIRVDRKENAIMVSLIEEPDDKVLNDEERKIVQAVCKKWKKASTQEVVDFTHRQIPWKICKDREVIPYALINNEDPENVY